MGNVTVQALKGVDVILMPGEFVSIMGPSGSGKSTLLNLLGCLDRPTEGSVLLDGIDVSKMNEKQLTEMRCKKIGYVFQKFYLLPFLTALENVELQARLAGIKDSRDKGVRSPDAGRPGSPQRPHAPGIIRRGAAACRASHVHWSNRRSCY